MDKMTPAERGLAQFFVFVLPILLGASFVVAVALAVMNQQ